MDFIYSIIIPHKNIPKLLQRCLDSIPERDDVQVIIVDDNSDSAIVDFEHFPGLQRKNTIVVFDKSSKGAGHARNIGIEHSNSKWLIFADADDFFNYCIDECLDKYKDASEDVIYFFANSLDSVTYVNNNRGGAVNNQLKRYMSDNENNEWLVRYESGVPWAKFFKSNVIEKNHIKFDETRIHNDNTFSYLAGYFAERVKGVGIAIYCVTYRDGSITYTEMDMEKFKDRWTVFAKRVAFMEQHNLKYFTYDSFFITCLLELKKKKDKTRYHEALNIFEQNGVPISLIKSFVRQRRKMDFTYKVKHFLYQLLKW